MLSIQIANQISRYKNLVSPRCNRAVWYHCPLIVHPGSSQTTDLRSESVYPARMLASGVAGIGISVCPAGSAAPAFSPEVAERD